MVPNARPNGLTVHERLPVAVHNDRSPIAFHDFVLDLARGDLRGPQGEIHLRPQAFRLLEVLVEEAPRVVPHDELMDRAWGTSHLSASALKQTISELRQVLGDDAGRPRFIATVPRRGYRFIAPIRAAEPAVQTEAGETPGLSTGDLPLAVPAGDSEQRKGPWRFLIAGLLLVLLVLAVVVLWPLRNRVTDRGHRPTLAVLGFKNLTESTVGAGATENANAEEGAWIGTALGELLGLDAVASGHFRWISGGTVATMRRELDLDDQVPSAETLRRIRRYSGADFVVRGSYYAPKSEDGRLEVQLVALDTRDGEAVAAVQSAAPLSDMIPLAHRLARRLWTELGATDEALFDSGPKELRAALPSGDGALQAYARGTQLARQLNWRAAVESLQAAADLDPTSPLVHGALAQAWDHLGFDRGAAEEAQRALELASDLPAPARLAVEARALSILGRRDEAIVAYRVLLRFRDDDPELALALAELQRRAGRLADAEATLAATVADPSDPRVALAAARLAFARGEMQRGLELCRDAERESTERGTWHVGAACELSSAWQHYSAGDLTAALHAGRSAVHLFETSGDRAAAAAATSAVAVFLSAAGHEQEAARNFRLAIETLHEVGDRDREGKVRNNFAAQLAAQGLLSEAIDQLERSRAIQVEVGDSAALLTTLVNLAELHRNAGERDRAVQLLAAGLALRDEIDDPRRIAQALRSRARLHQTDGNLDQARVDYREALGILNDLGDRLWAHRIEQLLGLLAFDQGQHAEGDTLLSEALRGFLEIEATAEAAEARQEVVRWALRRGRFEIAAVELETLLADAAAAEPGLAEAQLAAALVLRAEALRLGGDFAGAGKDLDRAIGMLTELERRSDLTAARIARARLTLESGRVAEVAGLTEELAAEVEDAASLGLSLAMAALQAQALAEVGSCTTVRSLSEARRPQLGELRSWERLDLSLDFALALERCGMDSPLDAIVSEAAALGYLELELQAAWHAARRRGDGQMLEQFAERAMELGFVCVAELARRFGRV